MRDFGEKERTCQASFACNGQYWHAFTNGKDASIIFVNDDEMRFAMNVIAQAAFVFKSEVTVIAFEVMNNHLHFILAGSEDDIREFFKFIRRRLCASIPAAKLLIPSLKPIADLNTLRNNIVYVNRNGYVANPTHTPFSYPWGTGRHYFNQYPTYQTISDLHIPSLRIMFRGRAPQLPGAWPLIDGFVAPTAFCAIAFGMALFRDAHHYFAAVSKNVEAYGGIAVEIDDGEFLTDQELFSQLIQKVRDQHNVASLRDLSKPQRLELAKSLHYDYKSSNGQIRRVLGLSAFEVDSLFPLSAKDRVIP